MFGLHFKVTSLQVYNFGFKPSENEKQKQRKVACFWTVAACGISLAEFVLGAHPWTSLYGQRNAIWKIVSYTHPTWNTLEWAYEESAFPRKIKANQRRTKA